MADPADPVAPQSAGDEVTLVVEQLRLCGDEAVLAVTGEVDTYTSGRLRDALDEAITAGARHIRLDVSAMEFIDSTGLGVLVGSLKKLRERDGTLTLRGPRQATLDVLSIVGLTSHFIVEEGPIDPGS